MPDATPIPPRNPWMVALTVLWSLLLLLTAVFLVICAQVGSQTSDDPGLPPSDVLSGIFLAVAGVTFGIALVVIAVQFGVGALRWYLDPASREVEQELVVPHQERQDF